MVDIKNEFDDKRLLTVPEAVRETAYPETLERFKKARGGEGYERYIFLIQRRYLIDSKLEPSGVPIEKSFKIVDGEQVPTFSAWWLLKKVKDHSILGWTKEYENRTIEDYIKKRVID